MRGNKIKSRLHVFGNSCQFVVDDSTEGAKELLALCHEELQRLEKKFSFKSPDSIISHINRNAGTGNSTHLDAESRSLFSFVAALWAESSHMFDPSVCLLKDYYELSARVGGSDEELKAILDLVGWSGLQINEQGALLSTPGAAIDLDSCVKPYAIDCVRTILVKNGVVNGLIEMDQDISSIGKEPDGANWLVGLRHPRGRQTAIRRIKLSNRGFARRGDFERRVTIDGEVFGRALSPVDGQPIPGLLSVAVIADNCLTACSAASIARLKTEPSALRWLETLGLPWMAIDRELNCLGPLAKS